MEDLPRTLLSQYFLHRLGLTCDELSWPNTSDDISKVDVSDTIPEAWRVRDAITEILKQNGVTSNFTAEEEVVSVSSLLDHVMPGEAEVAQFKSMYNSDKEDDLMDVDTNKLNIQHVYKAFNAAAYSVIRGHNQTKRKPVAKEEELHGQVYEPPLIQTMESIRTARITSLNEASGKSAPSFLKKNNTIPWFHAPVVDQKKQQPDDVLSAVKKVARRQSVGDKKEKAEKKTEVKKEEKKSVKRPAPETKAPAVKKPKLGNKTETSPKPNAKGTPKKKQDTQTTPSKAKSPTVRLGNQANVARAILCAAAAMVFQRSTPDFKQEQSSNSNELDSKIDPTTMPTQIIEVEAAKRAASKKKRDLDISVDVAMDQATIISGRILDRMLGATRRYDRRREFRLDIARSRVQRGLMYSTSDAGKFVVTPGHSLPLVVQNPFMEEGRASTDSEAMDTDEECCLTDGPVRKENDVEWAKACLPRLLSILRTGSGHAIMHDVQWVDRAFRVAELLQSMAVKPSSSSDQSVENYGPHLIVTTGQDIQSFAKAFGQIGHDLRVIRKQTEAADTAAIRVLKYHGSKEKRRSLRKHFSTLSPSPDSPFCFLGGQADSPYHVVLTTYSAFAKDYLHFCQIPFQAVVMDDGMSWLGCANADPNSKLGKAWETALWSSSDHGAGMAGVNGGSPSWDFTRDDGGVEKEAAPKSSKVGFMRRDSSSSVQAEKPSRGKLLVGLTARHRILLASSMHARCHGILHKASVSSLLSFLSPHFLDCIREDWDKSKMLQCSLSTAYLRKLVARSVVVYTGSPTSAASPQNLLSLVVKSLNGELTSSAPSPSKVLSSSPDAKKQAALQRKDALSWFRPDSSILTELNDSSLDSILNAVKRYNAMGFICEEIVPASTLTASGANGAVTGPAAFRMGVRCGRQFSNEQSLKQHMVAFHAPAGTWICKACDQDCVTSQAKSNHEKSCNGDTDEMIASAAMTAAMHNDLRRGPKRKEIKGLAAAKVKKDGSKRVDGFNGVWVKPDGKYFIKIEGKEYMEKKEDESQKDNPLLFETAEEAAKERDQILKDTGRAEVAEMNFKPDGSRIIHKKVAETTSTRVDAGVSEEAHHVIVPALAVVNIKNLPPDIKPLLRDPNQTSRTGGTSKRYVYAYRGVCRQARKGHDRWQAQISFNGFNHYLGTFDSEWDAAAVYAWAHLILYGEEATKQAQKEGEDAAAAYAQLQKDIADGKVDPSVLSSPKKKKRAPGAPKLGPRKGPRGPRKLAAEPEPSESDANGNTKQEVKVKTDPPKKPATVKEDNDMKETKPQKVEEPQTASSTIKPSVVEKNGTYTSLYSKKYAPKTFDEWNKLKTSCAMMLSTGTKGTSKATLLTSRKQLASMSNANLIDNVSNLTYGPTAFLKSIIAFGQSFKSMPTSIALTSYAPAAIPQNGAILYGLSAVKFGWGMEDFIAKCHKSGAQYALECVSRLSKEFGRAGLNASFRSLVLSTPCTIGKASEQLQSTYKTVGIKNTVGMSVENIGCDIGGPDNSCSEAAARIELLPTCHGSFQLLACNDKDIVTLNGERIQASSGAFPLKNHDVVSVGARVFVFLQTI